MHPDWIVPDWPAPARVRAVMTTRSGGVSRPPFDSFNTATHVEDEPAAVAENRRLLRQALPAEPLWLNQVHGNLVARFGVDGLPDADASVAHEPGQVCVVQTADCLPVLFCDRGGTVVAAAHAGWRGLAGGVLEETVKAMDVPPQDILAWMGAAIGPEAFEVGEEVREAFVSQHALAGVAFRPALPGTLDETPRKWLADIYALARIRLAAVGVEQVHGGGLCTFTDTGRFFSYRRTPRTGRMASLIWLQDQ
jgi:hypothetical protein